jgi:hypothetical protein
VGLKILDERQAVLPKYIRKKEVIKITKYGTHKTIFQK